MIIGCKKCSSSDCRGCNVYELYLALHAGIFTPVMNENHRVLSCLLQESMDIFAAVREAREKEVTHEEGI